MRFIKASMLVSSCLLSCVLFMAHFGVANAGTEPSPFQPEINQLGAAENILVSANKRIVKTMDHPPDPVVPSPNLNGALNRLGAINNQLVSVDDMVDSMIQEVMGVEPSPFLELPELVPALTGVKGAAKIIVDEIDARLGFEPSPFVPEFAEALQGVQQSAETISTKAQSYIDQISCAQAATDKVLGTYTRANCNDCQPGDDLAFVGHRELEASEAQGELPQTGFMFSRNDSGTWFELDFDDTDKTCVNVFKDGRARIAGLVTDGNGPQVDRVFGFNLEDHGWPAYFSDKVQTIRFSSAYNSDVAMEYAHHWCEEGNLLGDALEGYVVWPGIVIAGDLVICNTPTDGD